MEKLKALVDWGKKKLQAIDDADEDDILRWKKRIPVIVTAALFLLLVIAMLIIIPNRRAERENKEAEAQAAEKIVEDAEAAKKEEAYQEALTLLKKAEAGDASALSLIGKTESDVPGNATAAMLLFREALERFETLDGYLDSKACVKRCRDGIAAQEELLLKQAYEKATALLEDQQYSEAGRQFEALGEYEDSAEMVKESLYRKASGFFDIIRNYDVRGIQAELSMDPDSPSRVVLFGSHAPAKDSPCAEAILSACGKDPVEIETADDAEENLPMLAESVKELFASLKGYKDSNDCIAEILDITDYTKEFYQLCSEGDLAAAQEWLNDWDGDLDDREYWQENLERYSPYCASWSLYSGDKTAIPLSVGRHTNCMRITTYVTLDGEKAILHLTALDGDEEYGIDFYRETDQGLFYNDDNPPYNYVLVINNVGRLSYVTYRTDGGLVTSCEYKRD
ncbi:MAG: hypothetical protein IKS55_03215 [Oscillospiraceae bacterium]|nr:hypothetical protein [Oscillospiraceae bacterium]